MWLPGENSEHKLGLTLEGIGRLWPGLEPGRGKDD